MRDWNVIVTVTPGPEHESALLQGLRPLGEFHRSRFKDVILGRVLDMRAFLEALLSARQDNARWAGLLARAIPVEQTFTFTAASLANQIVAAAQDLLPRTADGSFHVRLERRGLGGEINTQRIEREVADKIFDAALARQTRLRVSFEDPDYILAAETAGEECGVALLTREMLRRYPFVQTRKKSDVGVCSAKYRYRCIPVRSGFDCCGSRRDGRKGGTVHEDATHLGGIRQRRRSPPNLHLRRPRCFTATRVVRCARRGEEPGADRG